MKILNFRQWKFWLKSKSRIKSETKQDNVYDYYVHVDEDIKRRKLDEFLDDVNRELRKYW